MADNTNLARQLVRKLATQLHDAQDRQLSIELSEEEIATITGHNLPGVSLDGLTLTFADFRARNVYAAEDFFSEIDTAAEELRLEHFKKSGRLAHYVESGDNKSIRGQFLARFDGQDLLSAAAKIIRQDNPAGFEVFSILQGVEDALPFLENITVESIIDLTEAQDAATRNDGARGLFFSKLQEAFLKHQELSVGIMNATQDRMSDTVAPLYHSAAIAYVKSDRAAGVQRLLRDVAQGSPALAAAAIWAIGNRLVYDEIEGELQESMIGAILTALNSDDLSLRRSALSAAASAAPKNPTLSHELLRLSELGDEEAIMAHATIILHHNYKDLKSHPDWSRWLDVLSHIPSSAKGAIDMLDMCLLHMVEDGEDVAVIEWIEKWIRGNARKIEKRQDKVVKSFNSALDKIFGSDRTLRMLLTRWVLTREFPFLISVQSILQHLGIRGVHALEFDAALLQALSPDEALVFAKQVLGYTHREEHLFSLFKSLAKSGNANFRAYLNEIFVEEIGEDYPGDTLKFLQEWRVNETDVDLIKMCDQAISDIKGRMDALDALPTLVELTPSSEASFEFRKYRQKMMARIQEEAHQNSIVAKIATQIPVKGGKGSISLRDGAYSAPSYFGSISSSVTLPRRHVMDALGSEMRLSHLRTFGLKGVE